MKLKRCPNLHYYDGDKYDRCPHCVAAKNEPAPPPKPVMEPAPVEPPKPEPVVEVKPESPKPEPVVEVKPEPIQPQPAAPVDESWRCACGMINSGKFCPQCGSPRPEPVAEAQPEPVAEPQPEPVVEAQPEPVVEVQPEPVVEVQPEPVIEPEPEPVVEVEPEPQVRKIYYQDVVEDVPVRNAEPVPDDDDDRTRVVFEEMEDDYVLGWLAVKNTSSKGKIFTLTSAKTTIGRADAAHPVNIDLRNDRSVSRGAQATFVYDPLNRQFFLQSAGGKTFVYVNREIVLTYTKLAPYDIVRIGETELVFVPLCSEAFSW